MKVWTQVVKIDVIHVQGGETFQEHAKPVGWSHHHTQMQQFKPTYKEQVLEQWLMSNECTTTMRTWEISSPTFETWH